MPDMETEKNTHPQPPYQALAWSYRYLYSAAFGTTFSRLRLLRLGDGRQGFIFRLDDLPSDPRGASLGGYTFTLRPLVRRAHA